MTHRPALPGLFVIALACLVSACALGSKSANLSHGHDDTLPARPGDKVNALIVEAGAAKTMSIWESCRADIGTASTCQVKHGTRLAVGPNTFVMVGGSAAMNRDPLRWELYLDNHPIDLNSFDALHFTSFRKGRNGQSEVFTVEQVWNVSISQVSGQHTLRSVLWLDKPADDTSESSRAPLAWVLNFAVDE